MQCITNCIYAVIKNTPIEKQVYVAGGNFSQIYEVKVYNMSMAVAPGARKIIILFFSKGFVANVDRMLRFT